MSPAQVDLLGAKPAMQVGRSAQGLPPTVETDVLVVGAGAAGLAAANAATRLGRDVIMLNAGTEPGGTINKGGGGFMVCANRFLREAGIVEDRALTLKLLARTSFPELYDADHATLGLSRLDYDLIATFYDRSAEVIEALEADDVLRTAPLYAVSGDERGFPSYFTHLDEEQIYFGRTLGVLTPDGLSGFGRELIRQLLAGASRKGARHVAGVRVTEILRDDRGEVTGVVAESAAGTHTLLARYGVIFATGGFAQNRALVEANLPGFVPGSCAVSTAQGDFVALTEDLDVELAGMDCAWWGEVPLEVALENHEVPLMVFVPFGDSMIYVDAQGRRVVNEKANYGQRGPIHFVRDEQGEQPNRVLFMIYDHAVARNPHDAFLNRWPVPPAGDHAPYVIEAETLEQLELRIRERLDSLADAVDGLQLTGDFAGELRRTIATFNRYAERGFDPEFRRGEEPVQVDCSGPPRAGAHPNPTMFPIAGTGPYYCIIMAAGCLDTNGGPRINTSAQVLRRDGSAIPRLYGAGNCIASPARSAYWTGGATVGLAMTYGYIAGQEVSRLEPRVDVGAATATA
jgi:3-oxosteroid 1-dehydrogenase